MSKIGSVKRRRRTSLFFKYMIFFLAVEIISLTAFGFVLSYFVTDSQKTVQKTTLYGYAENIAESYLQLIESADRDDVVAYAGLCYSLESVAIAANADIYIVDSDGYVIFCKDMASADGDMIANPECKHSNIKIPREIYIGIEADGMMATEGTLGGLYSENTFISACAVRSNSSSEADGVVFVIQPYQVGLRPYLTMFLQIYIMAAIALILVTSLIIYVLTYNMTRPLRDMSEATKRYANGDFSYRIRHDSRNTVREFDELSAAMNSMAESLKTLEASRSNFIANVSHELKTPMTTIGGFIDGILDGTISSENQSHYLKIVSDEVKRLSRLIVSMLNMTKVEAGELRINPVKFNLTEQIMSIFISFEQKIELKEIDVRGLEYLRNTYIEADSDMINQVFYNLIDNAVKFTNPGGEITVSMKTDGDDVIVRIKNTGKGIAEEDIDHIFERFYKGDKSRSLDSKSAGLGLFIVKNIVGLHKGEISVDTVDDRYTRFTVRLKTKLIEV